jgi:hypothetical protein
LIPENKEKSMPDTAHTTDSTSTSHIYLAAGVNLFPVGSRLTLGWLHPDTLSVSALETVLNRLTLVIGSGNYRVNNAPANPVSMPQVEIHLRGQKSSFTIDLPASFSPDEINPECILESVERMMQAYLNLRKAWREGIFDLSDVRLDWSGLKVLIYGSRSKERSGQITFALCPQLSTFNDESPIDDTL